MTDHVERNQEWAAVMRQELKAIWDGFVPNPNLATPSHMLGDEPMEDLNDLERRRAARRAELAAAVAAPLAIAAEVGQDEQQETVAASS